MAIDSLPGRLTFHCGLPKTGTTYLQQEVFPRAQGGRYVSGKSIFSVLADELSADSQRALVSEERLAWPNLWPAHRLAQRRQRKLAWLARTWPGSKLLLFLREPSELIRSHYAQHLHDGGAETFEMFCARFIDEGEFRFERLLDEIDAMPWAGVLLVDHRDLVTDPARVVGLIEEFSGMTFPGWSDRAGARNAAVSGHGARLLRVVNAAMLRVCGVAHPAQLSPWAAALRTRVRHAIQRGRLGWLNELGAPVVPRAAVEALRHRYAASWEATRARIAATQRTWAVAA